MHNLFLAAGTTIDLFWIDAVIKNSVFNANSAIDSGVITMNGGILSLFNSVFDSNEAMNGLLVCIVHTYVCLGGGDAHIIETITDITACSFSGGYGALGSVYAETTEVVISDCNYSNNNGNNGN